MSAERNLDELLLLLRAPKPERDNVRIRQLLAELKRANVGASVPLFAPLVDGCLELIDDDGPSSSGGMAPPPPPPSSPPPRYAQPAQRSRSPSPLRACSPAARSPVTSVRSSPSRPGGSPTYARPSRRQQNLPVSRKRAPVPLPGSRVGGGAGSLGLTVAWANNSTTLQADRSRLAEEQSALAVERRRLQAAQGKWAARVEGERTKLRSMKAAQAEARRALETERAKVALKNEQVEEQRRTTLMEIESERSKFEVEKQAWAEQSERRRAAVAASAARVEEQLRSLDAGQQVLEAERVKHDAAKGEAAQVAVQLKTAQEEIRDKYDTIARLGEALDSAEKAAGLAQQREAVARKDHEVVLAQLQLSGVVDDYAGAEQQQQQQLFSNAPPPPRMAMQWAPPPPPTPPPRQQQQQQRAATPTPSANRGSFDDMFTGLLPPGVGTPSAATSSRMWLRSTPPAVRASQQQPAGSSLSRAAAASSSPFPPHQSQMAGGGRGSALDSTMVAQPQTNVPSLEDEMAAAEQALRGLTDALRQQPQRAPPSQQQSAPAQARLTPRQQQTPLRSSFGLSRGPPPSRTPTSRATPRSVRVSRNGSIAIGPNMSSPLVALGL